GKVVEQATEQEPMSYLHGGENILPKVEEALLGKEIGDHVELTLEPADAYGEVETQDHIQRIPAKYVGGTKGLKPGQEVTVQMKDGTQRTVTVGKVGKFAVDVDVNHPLAGQTLTFSVTVPGVRGTAAEDVALGKVHGPGTHRHSFAPGDAAPSARSLGQNGVRAHSPYRIGPDTPSSARTTSPRCSGAESL